MMSATSLLFDRCLRGAKQPILGGCGLALLLGLVSCMPSAGNPERSAIEIIQLQQPPLPTETVRLRGRVSDRVPFLNSGAYLLQDRTGQIWVLVPDGRLPETGTIVVVEGQVEDGAMSIGGIDMTEIYFRQQSLLPVDSSTKEEDRSRREAATLAVRQPRMH